jgi:hypothetical protein
MGKNKSVVKPLLTKVSKITEYPKQIKDEINRAFARDSMSSIPRLGDTLSFLYSTGVNKNKIPLKKVYSSSQSINNNENTMPHFSFRSGCCQYIEGLNTKDSSMYILLPISILKYNANLVEQQPSLKEFGRICTVKYIKEYVEFLNSIGYNYKYYGKIEINGVKFIAIEYAVNDKIAWYNSTNFKLMHLTALRYLYTYGGCYIPSLTKRILKDNPKLSKISAFILAHFWEIAATEYSIFPSERTIETIASSLGSTFSSIASATTYFIPTNVNTFKKVLRTYATPIYQPTTFKQNRVFGTPHRGLVLDVIVVDRDTYSPGIVPKTKLSIQETIQLVYNMSWTNVKTINSELLTNHYGKLTTALVRKHNEILLTDIEMFTSKFNRVFSEEGCKIIAISGSNTFVVSRSKARPRNSVLPNSSRPYNFHERGIFTPKDSVKLEYYNCGMLKAYFKKKSPDSKTTIVNSTFDYIIN